MEYGAVAGQGCVAGVAVEPLAYVEQRDFSAGAFPGLERVPPNGAEDLQNFIVDVDGSLFRRGGTTYKSNAPANGPILGLWDGYLLPGRRTIFHTATTVYMLGADDASPSPLANGTALGAARWTQVANLLIRPLAPPSPFSLLVVGGAYPFIDITTGTATATQGSAAVVGTGTNWGGTTAVGGVLTFVGAGRPVAIKSVTDDTHLTLADPWPYATVTDGPFSIQPALAYASPDTGVASAAYQSHVTQMYGRLVLGNGNRLSFTHFNNVNSIDVPTLDFLQTEDFHLLSEGVVITGLEPLRDTLLIFTTAGLWSLRGLAFDQVDAAGNEQQHLEQVARDVVLWGETGIAAFRGGLVVPTTSDVVLYDGIGAPQPVTGGARELYRSYVKAGFQPGQAVVHRGHYLLPVLDGSNNAVDLMVWRLDMAGAPFSRWKDHGGRPRAFVVRQGDAIRQPLLLGAVSPRVESYSGVFERSSSDAPTLSLEVATGQPGSLFSSVSGTGAAGERVSSWAFTKRSRLIRFRLTAGGGSQSSEADSSEHHAQITTRTFEGPELLSQTWRRFRAAYESAQGFTLRAIRVGMRRSQKAHP